jgi:hypothetical protein
MAEWKDIIPTLPEDTTPNNTDMVPAHDGTTTKRVTFTTIKAFLKSYFDTLYQTTLQSGTNIKTINSTSLLGSGNINITGGSGGTASTIINVKDHGAVMDGVTNDSAALQAAMNAAKANKGGVIYIPQGEMVLGNYSFSGLTPSGDAGGSYIFRGEGSASKVRFSGLNSNIPFYFGNCGYVKFEGITFVGGDTAGGSSSGYESNESLFLFNYCWKVHFENCEFLGIATSVSGTSSGMIQFGNVAATFTNCIFGGNTATASAIVNMIGGRGLFMDDCMFLDYFNLDGVYYAKNGTTGSVKNWIRVLSPTTVTGADTTPNALVLRNCTFDENTDDALIKVIGTVAAEHSAYLENCSFTSGQNNFPAGRFEDLRKVTIKDTNSGYQGLTNPHTSFVFTDVGVVDLDNVMHKYGATNMELLGTTAKVRHKACTGITFVNTSGATIVDDNAGAKTHEVRTAAGTTDTLLVTDVGKELRYTNASAKVVTVPATSTLGTNFVCALYNSGAGNLTFTPAGGVTLRGSGNLAQYATCSIRAVGTDVYQITGEIT